MDVEMDKVHVIISPAPLRLGSGSLEPSEYAENLLKGMIAYHDRGEDLKAKKNRFCFA
jgi:hypothetical protein